MMYPTDNPQAKTPDNLRADIEYLTKTVTDAQHKPYLKPQLVTSLVSLGYTEEDAKKGVEAYFRVALN